MPMWYCFEKGRDELEQEIEQEKKERAGTSKSLGNEIAKPIVAHSTKLPVGFEIRYDFSSINLRK